MNIEQSLQETLASLQREHKKQPRIDRLAKFKAEPGFDYAGIIRGYKQERNTINDAAQRYGSLIEAAKAANKAMFNDSDLARACDEFDQCAAMAGQIDAGLSELSTWEDSSFSQFGPVPRDEGQRQIIHYRARCRMGELCHRGGASLRMTELVGQVESRLRDLKRWREAQQRLNQ